MSSPFLGIGMIMFSSLPLKMLNMYTTVSNTFLTQNHKLNDTSLKHYLQCLKSQNLYYTVLLWVSAYAAVRELLIIPVFSSVKLPPSQSRFIGELVKWSAPLPSYLDTEFTSNLWLVLNVFLSISAPEEPSLLPSYTPCPSITSVHCLSSYLSKTYIT